ncbi:MAG TPA: glycosyltransferase family 39 protein [Steroidobacteraceae bacterium]|nr:glycosyltransferase family 39 protein [Steroidobacteraceae bacterium]
MRSAAVLIVVALAPLWLLGIFGRGLWTPDEPREADVAWRMSQQSDRSLPQLADSPFLEKPPLSYWLSAAALSVFGDSPAALRAPNLLYALIGALAVAALALAMNADAGAAAFAAVIASSALLVYRTAIWLAPDACLLAGCALALLGAWHGYRAPAGKAKAAGYTLMHLGAAVGFMAKSAPGWLVPGLALLTLIAWERRWSELRRWELYAGLALQALIIGPWVLAVTRTAHGQEALLTLFWHNVVGRFTRVASPAALDYTSGHHNSPGKYFRELPVYLLPWTLLVLAAVVRALRHARLPGPSGTGWRFALAASVPFLILLSLAATARDVYAAPALLGLGLLAGLWLHEAQEAPTTLDRWLVRLTRWLVGAIAWALAGAVVVLGAAGVAPRLASAIAALAALAAAHTALVWAARALRRGDLPQSLGWSYTGYAAAFCLAALVAVPVIDRWQDLPTLARRIHADTLHEPLALLDPDETTIAMLDHGLRTPFTILTSTAPSETAHAIAPEQLVTTWFQVHGRDARVLVLLPGHAAGRLTNRLARFHPVAPPGDGVAGELIASGAATLEARYELPQGRRYALLGPPS